MSSSQDEAFDVVVIGGGPAGEIVAAGVAAAGLTAALVERELFGGECSYWACVPSKVLLRPVDLGHETAGVPGSAEPVVDPTATFARRDRIAALDDDSQVEWVEGAKVTAVRGRAYLSGERTVEVEGDSGTRRLQARQAVVIATGSDPNLPPIDGLAEAGAWTNREATRLTDVPRRLLVIGGGPVAIEMAQAVRGLGAETVTLVVDGARVLGRMEPFASELVLKGLEADGIQILLGAKLENVRRTEHGLVVAKLASGETIEADEVLVAAGRSPRTRDLGLERFGCEPGEALKVDDTLRVRDWLYAIGDVNGLAPLTHMGKYQGRIAAEAIAARARGEEPDLRGRASAPTPQVVFSIPQVAAVGMTTAEAAKAGLKCEMVAVDLASVAGATIRSDTFAGCAALVIDRARNVIVGCTFVGSDVGELLHAATIAITAEVPLQRLLHAVPCFPTVSEIWLKLIEKATA